MSGSCYCNFICINVESWNMQNISEETVQADSVRRIVHLGICRGTTRSFLFLQAFRKNGDIVSKSWDKICYLIYLWILFRMRTLVYFYL